MSYREHVPTENALIEQLTERYADPMFAKRIAPVLYMLLSKTKETSVKRVVAIRRGDIFTGKRVSDCILDLLSAAIYLEAEMTCLESRAERAEEIVA